jgi:hypothetical protein
MGIRRLVKIMGSCCSGLAFLRMFQGSVSFRTVGSTSWTKSGCRELPYCITSKPYSYIIIYHYQSILFAPILQILFDDMGVIPMFDR